MKKKKKFLLFIAGVSIPLLLFVFIISVIFLTPLLIYGGDEIYNDPAGRMDKYYGAESGGASMRLSGKGIFVSPLGADTLTITSGFGKRYHPIDNVIKNHTGIDIACNQGTPVYAVGDGVVGFAGLTDGYGNLIIIRHSNGYETYYGHLSEIRVSVGDKVVKGESVIGLSGGTPGDPGAGSSTGPHLHFEVRENGTPIDPAGSLGLVIDVPDVLPEELKYKEFDTDKLRQYLKNKNSLLADEPYFTTIINTARRYNVNAILLFSITGQEQSFVPKTDYNAAKIANNPFNVYVSWQQYNTDISDSAAIAAGTVINLSKGRPETVNPIAWINNKCGMGGGYAGDGNWWVGVSNFFAEIKQYVQS